MKNNFNAPEPVARAAVLYAFRVMVEDMIPMNAGCLRPINIVIPDGCMLKPAYPAAVVAGNVETSQHVTNALFGAMGAIANAQGTMNNLTFGNDEYQYYETICSGSPAGRMNNGRGFAGTSGVHTHMTNSRLTDPEVLELRFPVLLEDFHIRDGLRRQGKMERRRRHQAHHPLPRKDGMRDPVVAPQPPAARTGRRRRRPGRQHRGAAARRPRRGAARLRPDGAGSRRSGDRDDADAGRVRGGVTPESGDRPGRRSHENVKKVSVE